MLDDDQAFLVLTKSLLKRKGFDVIISSDWDDASEKIKAFNPQLVSLDVFLNNSDGLQICSKLKSSPFTRHIPVLILSGYSRLAETAICEFGADDFVTKPFEVDEMIDKMHYILSRKHHSHRA